MKTSAILICLIAAIGIDAPAAFAQSKPVILITAEESKLNAAPTQDLTFRAGVSRGPSITVLSPKPADPRPEIADPLATEIRRTRRGAIDADSLKLTYVKTSAVDLTERIDLRRPSRAVWRRIGRPSKSRSVAGPPR
jgi:hypothetical protein